MITTEKPSEFNRPGYEACVCYDPEPINYDFSEWEDETSTGWFNFVDRVINVALGEYADIHWEPYDAGAIFYGNTETCKKIYEKIEAVRKEYPLFDIDLVLVDLKCEFPASECIWQEQISGEWVETHSIEESTVSVEQSERFGNIIWVTNSPWMEIDNALLICDYLSENFKGFYFIPSCYSRWIEGDDGCMGIPFTVSTEQANISLAAQLAQAVGYEVIVP